MGANCDPLVADLLLFCYVVIFDNNQTDVIGAFNSTLRYLDYLLNIEK